MRLFAIMIGLVHILSRRMLERSKEHVHRKAVPTKQEWRSSGCYQAEGRCYQAEGRC